MAVLLSMVGGISDPLAAPFARSLAPSFERRVDAHLLAEIFRASGIDDPAEEARYGEAFHRVLADLARVVDRSHSPYRRARLLHKAIQRRFLRHYNETADGLQAILDRGEYNCLSATLFYALSARAFGFEVRVLEMPRHVFVRLILDGRDIDIETTSVDGFDLCRKLERFLRFVRAYKFAVTDEEGQRSRSGIFANIHEEAVAVRLEEAVAFLWHNVGERALDRGEALEAAHGFREESRIRPPEADRSDALTMSLARAFRIEYEAGRFDAAYRIAAIDLEIFPGRTSSRDRLLAAALKGIEQACDRGTPGKAEDILGQAGTALQSPEDRDRLGRSAAPLIAAAAVRLGEWTRADRMAERFAESQPDRVEVARLTRWVDRRRHEASSALGRDACWEPDLTMPLADGAGPLLLPTRYPPAPGVSSRLPEGPIVGSPPREPDGEGAGAPR